MLHYTTTKLVSYDSNFTPKSLQSHSHSVSANNSHNAACFSPNLHWFQQMDSPQKQRGFGFGSQPSRPQYNRVLLCTRLSKVQKNGSSFIMLCCFFPNSFPQIVWCRQIGFLYSCELYSIGFLCITWINCILKYIKIENSSFQLK